MTHRSQAILLMCSGVLMLSINDAAAKWMLVRYDPLQIAFMRSSIALPIVTAVLLRIDGKRGFHSWRPGVHAVRALIVVLATMAFFTALRSLSLAEATSLLFTAPIIVAAIAVPLLKEDVSVRRWVSVLLGFVGVLIVIRPGVSVFVPGSAYALLAAFLYALIMISARWIDHRDSLWTMTFWMTSFSVLFGAVSLTWAWPTPTPGDAAVFLTMAVAGTGGAAFISQAFRLAPASLVAPLDYSALLWATLIGWLVWGTVPAWPVYAGAAIIVASGILLLGRENGQ